MELIDDPKSLLRSFLWSKKWAYGLSSLSIIASEIVTVQFPYVLGNFTDALQARRLTGHSIAMYSLTLLAIGALYMVLYGIGQLMNGHLGRAFEYQLRERMFLHWERLSAAYFHRRSTGDLLNHALNDVRAVRDALSGGMNILFNAVFLLLSALYMTFRTVSVKLTLVAIIPILFVPLFVVFLGPRLRDASRQVQEALSDVADLAEESLSAIRVVKATSNEAVEARRFRTRLDAIVVRQMAMFRRSATFQSLIPLMGSISFAIALLYGGYLTVSGRIHLGEFVAFTLYLTMMIQPLQQLGSVFNNFQRASASLRRLTVLLTEEPDIADAPKPVQPGHIKGEVEVRLPEYRYPGGNRAVLRQVQFHIPAGQTLGIIGRTGSGKTTLVNLLPRIFDPPPGTVFIDGIDVRDLALADLRQAIAYVPQDGFLFSTSIGENIGFSRETATQGEIEEAARLASIHDEIVDFPQGYDTLVGERGITLSGGQRQRAAIARALLKQAPILILDDSLSAVDMNTEKRILENLRRVRRGRTTIVISHRLSAVRHADRILVLDDGEVVERGTHDELVAKGGVYASIYAMQEGGAVG
ncbi:ABC transporter ATP-binding protein [Alicyclobacillus kakegawensis]|uniref:ABC transporter ATP-binding protein n=1 Tax=Alicyclobacillus kakegawensis TaxID=392012 RepID=UPI000A7C8BC8|nr:ABC transporter ATP-binding protein [Alicyclobacillus kakegawensis]